MALMTIVRKQLTDTRWSLLSCCLAFYGLSILWNWGVSVNQFPPPEWERRAQEREKEEGPQEPANAAPAQASEDPAPDTDATVVEGDAQAQDEATTERAESKDEGTEPPGPRPGRRRGTGIYTVFGVPAERLFNAEEPPTLAMQVALANHPLITLALLGWAIARGSASVAGEIERGSLDLTLSRPVYRSTYLFAQVLTTIVVFLLLGIVMVVGHATAPFFFQFKNLPSLTQYFPSFLMVLGFGLAVYGYTLVFSAGDLVRARVGIIGLGVTLGGIAGIIFARQYEGYEWLEKLSVYHFYWPVGIVVEWTRELSRNLVVLYGIFASGVALALLIFLRRDLPTSG